MPTRHIYISEPAAETWTKVDELAKKKGISLSAILSDLLTAYVKKEESKTPPGPDELRRIVVTLHDKHGHAKKKAFKGKMLISGYESDWDEDWDAGFAIHNTWNAAQGESGRIVVWTESDNDSPEFFKVFEGWDDISGEDMPQDVISAIGGTLGEDYAEEVAL